MKIKDIINYLNSDYFLISSLDNEYFVQYLRKNDLSDEVLNASLAQIEPVVAIKKSVFEDNAGDNDFVAALKLVTGEQVKTQKEPVYEKEKVQEESYTRHQEHQEPPHNPFSGIPFGFDMSMLNNLITPEMIENFTQSDLFKDLMSPENISQILQSDDFKNFTQNVDLKDIMKNMYSPQNPQDYSQDEYEEYEEFDDDDDSEYDDDEYEEI